MQTNLPKIREAGAEVVAISADTPETLRKKVQSRGIEFPLLADPELAAIDAYGLRHEGADPFSGGDIARPAVFIIGEDGQILWRHLTDNWRVRVTPETILEQLETGAS